MREPSICLRTAGGGMQRVLITTDTIGGVWHYTIELAAGLNRLGVEPVIAALGAPPSGMIRIGKFPVFIFPCRLEWMEDPWEDVRRSGDWLLQLAGHLKPDVIHLNGYAHAARRFSAPVLVVGHSCVYSWYRAVRNRPPSARWRIYHQAVAGGLAAADGVTAPSTAMLSALEDHYGPFNKVQPIPNGRRSRDFPPAGKKPFIFSAGRLWDEAKNIAALAHVAGKLAWPVIVAGEERHPEGGRVRYQNIHLLGFLDQSRFSGWMSRASIYALPALYEPFGLTVLEAAFAECALVLGDIPSLRENWDGAALFVPPRRTDMLEAALKRLIDNDRLRRRCARRARQRALTLDADKMARRYAALYGRLISDAQRLAGSPQPRTA